MVARPILVEHLSGRSYSLLGLGERLLKCRNGSLVGLQVVGRRVANPRRGVLVAFVEGVVLVSLPILDPNAALAVTTASYLVTASKKAVTTRGRSSCAWSCGSRSRSFSMACSALGFLARIDSKWERQVTGMLEAGSSVMAAIEMAVTGVVIRFRPSELM